MGVDPEACREGAALVPSGEAAALDWAAWAGEPFTVLGTLPGTWEALLMGSRSTPFGVEAPVLGFDPTLEV